MHLGAAHHFKTIWGLIYGCFFYSGWVVLGVVFIGQAGLPSKAGWAGLVGQPCPVEAGRPQDRPGRPPLARNRNFTESGKIISIFLSGPPAEPN